MPNQVVAELISKSLVEGILHPGDEDQPSKMLVLPFNTKGQHPEQAKLVNLLVKQLGEAIVHLIETQAASEIVSKEELGRLRIAVDGMPEPVSVAVYCRRCGQRRDDPLMHLTLTGQSVVEIDGRQLISVLTKRESACPHRIKE